MRPDTRVVHIESRLHSSDFGVAFPGALGSAREARGRRGRGKLRRRSRGDVARLAPREVGSGESRCEGSLVPSTRRPCPVNATSAPWRHGGDRVATRWRQAQLSPGFQALTLGALRAPEHRGWRVIEGKGRAEGHQPLLGPRATLPLVVHGRVRLSRPGSIGHPARAPRMRHNRRSPIGRASGAGGASGGPALHPGHGAPAGPWRGRRKRRRGGRPSRCHLESIGRLRLGEARSGLRERRAGASPSPARRSLSLSSIFRPLFSACFKGLG